MCLDEKTTKECSAQGCTTDDSVYCLERCCMAKKDGPCEYPEQKEAEVDDTYLCGEHGGGGSLTD